MKIMVINPNTSDSMTEKIRQELGRVKRSDTEIVVVQAEHGPETIESAYDEALCVPSTLEWVKRANQEGYDAVIIDCFSDPGLEAAKEMSSIPVVGIHESSLHLAAMLGARFTVITSRKERVPSKREHVFKKGLEHFLASVRCLDLSVAETDADPERAKKKIFDEVKKAVAEDGAEVIILGCSGMAGYGYDIESKLKVKVLDPSAVALKVAEAMVDLGMAPSKAGLFATPPQKRFK